MPGHYPVFKMDSKINNINPLEIYDQPQPKGVDYRGLMRIQAQKELSQLQQQKEQQSLPKNISDGVGSVIQQVGDKAKQFLSPLAQKFGITQQFGAYNPGLYKSGYHPGLDLATPAGTQVKAPVSGKVELGHDPQGYGTYVRVIGDDGTIYQFSHLSSVDDLIKQVAAAKNQILAGQSLGTTGGIPGTYGAGKSTGAHLDISTIVGGKNVDPLSIDALRRALM
jgi:murein DD-endopeptidase MepM/ murein hydrolase activator NlpD